MDAADGKGGRRSASESVAVRAVTKVDETLVEALVRLLPQVSKRGSSLTRSRVRHVVDTPGSTVYVATIGDRIVGCATLLTLVTLVGQFGYLEEVVVDEAERGQGVGAALIGEICDAAAQRGLDFVELTSRSEREAANRLYRSAGFAVRETNVYRRALR